MQLGLTLVHFIFFNRQQYPDMPQLFSVFLSNNPYDYENVSRLQLGGCDTNIVGEFSIDF